MKYAFSSFFKSLESLIRNSELMPSRSLSGGPTGLEIQPDLSDNVAIREISLQRVRWETFLCPKKGFSILNEGKVWQHRHVIATSPVETNISGSILLKKIFSNISPKSKKLIKLKSLIRGGIPPELRGSIWWVMSGAEGKKLSFVSDYGGNDVFRADDDSYFQYLISQASLQEGQQVCNDINKDLSRTFPTILSSLDKGRIDSVAQSRSLDTNSTLSTSHDTISCSESQWRYSRQSFISALRRILLAYARHNPRVGYCQSMNYICAMLLFHVRDEEKVFWMLAVIVEDICANYYIPSLIGVRADNLAFQALLAFYSPELYATFKSTDTLLEPIVMPWFLCLYINALPPFAVCRVWDCLFWQGREVLFRVGIHLLRSKFEIIKKEASFSAVYAILKSENIGNGHSFQLEKYRRIDKKSSRASLFRSAKRTTPPQDSSDHPRESEEMSDAENLIVSTFKTKLPFIRAKIRHLRSTISERLLTADKLQRRLEITSQSLSNDLDMLHRMNMSYISITENGDTCKHRSLPRQPSLIIPFVDPAKQSSMSSNPRHSKSDLFHRPVVEEMAPVLSKAALERQSLRLSAAANATDADDLSPLPIKKIAPPLPMGNSSTIGGSLVRKSSRGVLTAFFSTPRTTYVQRMPNASDSCFSINSVASTRASEKRLSLIRVVTEEELT